MNEQEKLTQNTVDTRETTEKAPVSSIIPDSAYYPGFGKHGKKRHPDERLIAYAEACIDVVRQVNDKAANLYIEVVRICKEPECQKIFANFKKHYQRRPYDTWNLVETYQCNPLSESVSDEITQRMEGLHYPSRLTKSLEDFVLHGFNSPDDIRYQTPRVVYIEENPLSIGLVTIAFFDALGLSEQVYNIVKEGAISDLFGGNPRTRRERKRKERIIDDWHKAGFGAVSKHTLLRGAVLWYKARVNPGSLAEACNELHLEYLPFYSTILEPYNRATGYR